MKGSGGKQEESRESWRRKKVKKLSSKALIRRKFWVTLEKLKAPNFYPLYTCVHFAVCSLCAFSQLYLSITLYTSITKWKSNFIRFLTFSGIPTFSRGKSKKTENENSDSSAIESVWNTTREIFFLPSYTEAAIFDFGPNIYT